MGEGGRAELENRVRGEAASSCVMNPGLSKALQSKSRSPEMAPLGASLRLPLWLKHAGALYSRIETEC